MNYVEALGLARYLVNTGFSLDEAVNNPAIPSSFSDQILQVLREEENIILEPANVITDNKEHIGWLNTEDRSNWYYWPTLRQYLLTKKEWSNPSVQSLDKETDRILGLLAPPNSEAAFDKKGLVLGFVQSGKTSNYAALIAKAADSGYRLIIVLSGIDNGLRLQTHHRLKSELIGSVEGTGVPLPPIGQQWHEFTRDDLHGDFRAGYVNTAALQGSQPVLLVIKKNGAVLRRLLHWLEDASEEIKRTIPLLVIDDESDLASVDTRGSHQAEEEPLPDDFEPPSVINGLIRDLLNKFNHKSYVAYTATPFANILIPHDNYDPRVSDDLYPRNFIVNLPKPYGYFGAEELFGRMDDISEEEIEGIDVIRPFIDPDSDDYFLQKHIMPVVMEKAILSFVLAGAARAHRNKKDFPATMLIHISLRIIDQLNLSEIVDKKFTEFKDEWRYSRKDKIYDRLRQLWEKDFLPVIKLQYPRKVIDFKELESNISTFFESVQIRTLNSATGDVLDYRKEPNLKAIAIGGNKLSRGLTLEGLLVSFFARRTIQYDTLMQMGRWFGFREGYEDLTRIYTTPELAGWFTDLANVEYLLREDIKIYEEQQLTPIEVGMRIKSHPIMQVTSPLKRRFAAERIISKSYSGEAPQTIMFPLKKPELLVKQEEHNLLVVKEFLSQLGEYKLDKKGPVWSEISTEKIIKFLDNFVVDDRSYRFFKPLIIPYIKRLKEKGELTKWIVAICGREKINPNLGEVDWELENIKIKQINLSRVYNSETLKAIVSQGDEMVGLSDEEKEKINEDIHKGNSKSKNVAARKVRSASEGLILLYPISKYSEPSSNNRSPLYNDPNDSLAKNLIGIAISFPHSKFPQSDERYIEGTVPWRPADEF